MSEWICGSVLWSMFVKQTYNWNQHWRSFLLFAFLRCVALRDSEAYVRGVYFAISITYAPLCTYAAAVAVDAHTDRANATRNDGVRKWVLCANVVVINTIRHTTLLSFGRCMYGIRYLHKRFCVRTCSHQDRQGATQKIQMKIDYKRNICTASDFLSAPPHPLWIPNGASN